ncbi:hypothetical protein CSHISOI_07575, partial [Colletotrichum shisoi]
PILRRRAHSLRRGPRTRFRISPPHCPVTVCRDRHRPTRPAAIASSVSQRQNRRPPPPITALCKQHRNGTWCAVEFPVVEVAPSTPCLPPTVSGIPSYTVFVDRGGGRANLCPSNHSQPSAEGSTCSHFSERTTWRCSASAAQSGKGGGDA